MQPKFNVGDRVVTAAQGVGTVIEADRFSVGVRFDDWFGGHGGSGVRGCSCWNFFNREEASSEDGIALLSLVPSTDALTPVGVEVRLREQYPNGHARFIGLTMAEMDLHSQKNHDYAAGGDPLGNFKRVAAILAMYPGLKLDDPAIVAFTYALKQVDAYLWLKSNGHTAKVEGIAGRLPDISVYVKLAQIMEEQHAGPC